MKITFHYLTDEPDKIMKKIKQREEPAIEKGGWELMYWNMISKSILPPYYPDINYEVPGIEDIIEQVVIKKWGNIISIYPLTVTPYQEKNISWTLSKYDYRKNSITQKHGSIISYWGDGTLTIGFWRGGELIRECELPVDDSLAGSGEYTFQRCAPEGMLQAINDTDFAKQHNGIDLDIPIMLPSAWKELWTICDQTQFITICE